MRRQEVVPLKPPKRVIRNDGAPLTAQQKRQFRDEWEQLLKECRDDSIELQALPRPYALISPVWAPFVLSSGAPDPAVNGPWLPGQVRLTEKPKCVERGDGTYDVAYSFTIEPSPEPDVVMEDACAAASEPS